MNPSSELLENERSLLDLLLARDRYKLSGAQRQLDWLAQYVATGCITLVTGKPKEAGKTTFLLHLLAALLKGENFLGRPTQRVPVLYFSEEASATFMPVLDRTGLFEHPHFHALPREQTAGYTLAQISRVAAAAAAQIGARVLVIDTLAYFAGFEEGQEMDPSAMTAAINQLHPATCAGLAVVLVHHDRKSGGGIGGAVRGSNALVAGINFVLSLRQESKSRGTTRALRFFGRAGAKDEQVVQLTDAGYAVVGREQSEVDGGRVRRRARREPTLSLRLPVGRQHAITVAQVAKRHAKSESWAQGQLEALCRAGEAAKDGKGVKGQPAVYFRPETPEAWSAVG